MLIVVVKYAQECVLGTFAKLQKATISFSMSAHPSTVCLSFHVEHLGSRGMDFPEI
jgi:hypothetical protein